MPEMSNSDCGDDAVPGYHRHSHRKGKPVSPERRAKISAALTGEDKERYATETQAQAACTEVIARRKQHALISAPWQED